MGFVEAVTSAFNNYFNFSSRASRSAFWYFVLFLLIAGLVTTVLDIVLSHRDLTAVGPLNGLFTLATIVPNLALSARRLHDIGRSGWWLLLAFVPLVGIIVLLYWWCAPGVAVANAYGPPPLR